jgi:hypothetical protein
MVERLFFNRVYTKPARAAIRQQHHGTAEIAAHKAQAALVLVQFAKAWTDLAFDPAIFQRAPKPGWKNFGRIDSSVHNEMTSQRCLA